jgi:arginase
MAEGAGLGIPYPEVGVVDRDTLEEQSAALATMLPAKPIVLGGCCCTHVGAARGLASRVDRLGIVWIDAHGDLNTPESSPSGNLWGMPLRMLLDEGVVAPDDVALVGVRNLDPPEAEYLAETGIDGSLERALAGAGAVYVSLDLDVLDPSEADVFMAEPNGASPAEIEAVLRETGARATIVGVGITGFVASVRNAPIIARLLAAAGL